VHLAPLDQPMTTDRERWTMRLGVVLAMAGGAVGLGNFLRFPVQAARNGGGAFLIPYFVSLIVMGIPLMWLEWAMGRWGGARGHGTTPGMFQLMWRHPVAKYLGVLGLFTPTVIMIYYTYIESWTLGYSVLHLLGHVPAPGPDALGTFAGFKDAYVGVPRAGAPNLLAPAAVAYAFFLVTLALNVWILMHGVARGIELLARIAMPMLVAFAVVLVAWVLTLSPRAASPLDGLGYLWNPNLSALLDFDVWLAAAGQIFFSLALGMGTIQCYASYLRESDDVMLTGLSTTATNEFVEVVLGGSIAIPAAVTFFGLTETRTIAESGSFYLGFVSMPAIFATAPGGAVFGALWFALLFLAGLTTSVAMLQPVSCFLQEEFGVGRRAAAVLLGVAFLVTTHLCIFLRGALDVMDFWAGTVAPSVLALIEAVLLMWIFGGRRTWAEMHRGADLRAPTLFYVCARYLTPVFLIVILGGWLWQTVAGADPAHGLEGAGTGWPIWVTRVFLVALYVAFGLLARTAWRRREREGRT
jgi:NSS family neurotransmitter:Na+ symporter